MIRHVTILDEWSESRPTSSHVGFTREIRQNVEELLLRWPCDNLATMIIEPWVEFSQALKPTLCRHVDGFPARIVLMCSDTNEWNLAAGRRAKIVESVVADTIEKRQRLERKCERWEVENEYREYSDFSSDDDVAF